MKEHNKNSWTTRNLNYKALWWERELCISRYCSTLNQIDKESFQLVLNSIIELLNSLSLKERVSSAMSRVLAWHIPTCRARRPLRSGRICNWLKRGPVVVSRGTPSLGVSQKCACGARWVWDTRRAARWSAGTGRPRAYPTQRSWPGPQKWASLRRRSNVVNNIYKPWFMNVYMYSIILCRKEVKQLTIYNKITYFFAHNKFLLGDVCMHILLEQREQLLLGFQVIL